MAWNTSEDIRLRKCTALAAVSKWRELMQVYNLHLKPPFFIFESNNW